MLIKNLMNNAEFKQIKINCFISDSAGEYAAARHQLRIEYLSKVFLPCMAHQMNLVVGDIFKESLQYKQVSKNAVCIVSYFHSSPYFTGLLRNEQTSCYGQTIALIIPGETRWNSYHFCFHSILKTEAALKDIARLYEIAHYFGWIIKIFSFHKNVEFVSKFNSSAKNISYTYFGQWLIYYYQAWFNETPKEILHDYLLYQRKLFPFNSETYNQFEKNIIDFWESTKGLAPELLKLAFHLFGICVNATSVERLWLDMGFLHSTRQNKLHHKKVLAMAQFDTEELEETSVIDECNVNDTFEKTNNSDNINSEQWTKIIEDWIKIFNAEININNTEVIGKETYEFEIGGQSIHPADNPLAK
ncbi:hypothetical protein RhiirC2_857993 [Rhizophagus irregularis]|uniref:HAT C-terminal dimerisation domain-containing protein n=1 Tax=Rhizophagus irregularis TaxID=588596 RepID=A0A2N1M8K4_9GLOM|nr:hypothetical protein RhiirC2_857993 [Rhizophagus irregularis]